MFSPVNDLTRSCPRSRRCAFQTALNQRGPYFPLIEPTKAFVTTTDLKNAVFNAVYMADSIEASCLDLETLVLVRIAALAAVDAPAVSCLLNLGAAGEIGLDPEQVRGVLARSAPISGTARVASATGKIVDALEVAIEIAELEEEDDNDDQAVWPDGRASSNRSPEGSWAGSRQARSAPSIRLAVGLAVGELRDVGDEPRPLGVIPARIPTRGGTEWLVGELQRWWQ